VETGGTKKGLGNGQNNEEKFLGIQSMLKAQSEGNARQWVFVFSDRSNQVLSFQSPKRCPGPAVSSWFPPFQFFSTIS